MSILKYKPTHLEVTAKIADDPALQAALARAIDLAADADRDEATAKRFADCLDKALVRHSAKRAKQSRQAATDAANVFVARLRTSL